MLKFYEKQKDKHQNNSIEQELGLIPAFKTEG